MSLYTKALKHIDMNRVKELREEKLKQKRIVDEIREQIREELRNLNSPEFSNWRYDLDEGMTTSALMTTTLPATGDVDLVTTEETFATSFNGQNESVSGGEVILAGTQNSIVGGTHTIYRRAMFNVDSRESSTLKLTIIKGGGTSSWTDRDPAENFDDDVKVNISELDAEGDKPRYYNANLSSGTHLIDLPGQFKNLKIQIEQFAKVSATGALRITGASLQRRTPVNVFVSLDSPEASNFIRTDSVMQGLSAEERRKKLIDMLDAGDEYLSKYLGIIGSSARPSETTTPPSWEPKNDTEKFADDNDLPRDYKDKLSKANAYFHNNLNGIGYRTLGFNDMDRMNALKKISYEKQGFTPDQIDTIEREQLVRNTYGSSPTYKEPEPEKKPVEKPQYNSNRYNSGSNTSTNTITSYRTGGSRSTSTSDPFMNIRVGNTNNTNTSTSGGGKDYGNIAQSDNVDRQIDNMLLRGLERGDYGTGPNIQKQIDNLKRNLRNKTPGGSFLPLAGGRNTMDVAHYKPEGEVLSEKKRLKSPKDIKSLRCDLDESMTTSSIYSTTLPARGDVNLGTAIETFSLSGPGGGGHPDSFNKNEPSTIGNYQQFDTIVVTVNSTTPRWSIDPIDALDELGSGGVGTYQVVIPRTYPGLFFAAFDTGTITVSATYQRRAPVNVFVSLDSPEATNFIRTDPSMQGLSAEDRKKKLIDMLDAGDEYLLKQLGIIGSSARPSDTTMPGSWEQAAGGATDAMSDDLYNWVNKTYGLPAAEWKKDNPTKPDNSNPFLPKGSYVPKASGSKDYGNIAVKVRPIQGPSTEVYYDKKMKQFVPRNSGGVALDQVRKAHYEPKGETIMEKNKKSFKDITNKIPGYYDGKPAPLGFPMQEPPKMVNGKHPDLVDGKKIANRFNRLDPQSAKAMPPTGNPHIDKKVRAAAKKPK